MSTGRLSCCERGAFGPTILSDFKREYEAAGRRLAEAVEAAFPVGSIVAVTLGSTRILAEVLSAGGSWWHEPSQMSVRNIRTGKIRRFSATYESCGLQMITPNKEVKP